MKKFIFLTLILFISMTSLASDWLQLKSLFVDDVFMHKKSAEVRFYKNKSKYKTEVENIPVVLNKYIASKLKVSLFSIKKNHVILSHNIKKKGEEQYSLNIYGKYELNKKLHYYREWVEYKNGNKTHSRLIIPAGIFNDDEESSLLKDVESKFL